MRVDDGAEWTKVERANQLRHGDFDDVSKQVGGFDPSDFCGMELEDGLELYQERMAESNGVWYVSACDDRQVEKMSGSHHWDRWSVSKYGVCARMIGICGICAASLNFI
ncbi:hypothetical protein KEM48_013747 [Puccinia striiformis f. sp. tritici PST-130]|nr:hypothetical protein Pst134EB_014131 [Puccinia striiformis f. sp. tritici]KAI9630593.1 hypothetical protein KEM48_013747 [Puccinia striiformis f. sp. tritici PST-130]